MSVNLELTINHGYDRVRPIETGQVAVEGIDLDGHLARLDRADAVVPVVYR